MNIRETIGSVLLILCLVGCGSNKPTDQGHYLHFVTPKDGEAVSGDVRLLLDASLPESITQFEVGVEGQGLGTYSGPLPSLEFDTTTLENGPHTFVARAVAQDGATFEDTVDVTVNNAAHQLEYYLPSQPGYAKGETVSVELKYPVAGLKLDCDFSPLDSSFDPSAVLVQDLGAGAYRVDYPVSAQSTAAAGLHDVRVAAVDSSGSETSANLRLRLQSLPSLPIIIKDAIFVDRARPDARDMESGAPEVVDVSAPSHVTTGVDARMDVAWASKGNPAEKLIVFAEGYHGYYVVPVAHDANRASLVVELPPSSSASSSASNGNPVTLLIGAVDGLGQYLGLWSQRVTPHPIQPSGARVYVTWDTPMDLDLSVTTPGGSSIGFANPSDEGGTLAMDSNALCAIDGVNTEVIIWPQGKEPIGEFTISLDAFNACDEVQTKYRVVAVACGKTQVFEGVYTAAEIEAGNNTREIGRFTIDCERRVHGRVAYLKYDDRKLLMPLRTMPVRAVTGPKESPEVLAEGVSDGEGQYALYLPGSGYDDYRLEVEASWKDPRTNQVMVEVKPKDDDSTYVARSVPFNAAEAPDRTLNLHFEKKTGSGPLQMTDVVRRGFEWVTAFFSSAYVEMVDPVEVRWTSGAFAGEWTVPGSYYQGDALWIGGSVQNPDEVDSSIVEHEFMHHVSYSMTDWIIGGTHYYNARSNPALAYNEGLATGLAQTALGDPVYLDTANGSRCRIDLENRWGEGAKQTDGGLDVDSTNGKAIGTSNNRMDGDLNEFLVSAVLWDLMDPIGDPIFDSHDQIADSYSATLGSFSRYVPMDGREDRGPADPDFVDFLDGWRCYSFNTSDAALRALLEERQFPYDFPTDLCRH